MSTAPQKPAIFTDVDGTLVFGDKNHGIKMVKAGEGGICQVRAPNAATTVKAHPLAQGSEVGLFIAVETRERAKTLMRDADIFVVTATRRQVMEQRSRHFDFLKGLVLQSGGGIYDPDFRRDEAWHDHLKPERILMGEIKRVLSAKSLRFLDQWEDAQLRIRAGDNPNFPGDALHEAVAGLQLPEGLQLTRNLGHYDIILASAGKDKAVKYLMDRDGYKPEDAFGIGDDVNDIPMLSQVGHGYVLGSGFPEAVAYARASGLYVSKGLYFDGINEIFETIRTRIKPLS